MDDFNARLEDQLAEPELKCLDSNTTDSSLGTCEGKVEYRYALSSSGKSFPRCDKHWEKRLEIQEGINKRYAPNSDVPPEGFDPTYAGERWDEDY